MIRPLRHLDKLQRRPGFTLVELLVAMSIFIVLATFAISAWRGTDQDRVSNGAAIFKNALEGAKSRAVKSNQARGLRLNLDPNNNRIVTSMVYVDGGRFETGELIAEYDNRGTGRYAVGGPDGPPTNDPQGYNPNSSGRWRVASHDSDPDFWEALLNNQLIGNGTLIEIPSGSSFWLRFTGLTEDRSGKKWWILQPGAVGTGGNIAGVVGDPAPESGRDKVSAGTSFSGEGFDGMGDSTFGLSTSVASAPISYRMQLLPAILAGAEPISLPQNTCLDLDGSKVPVAWRPTSNPSAPKPAYGPATGFMDILFTPKGTIARPLTTEGILHFRIASTVDLLLGQSSISSILPDVYASRPNPVVFSDPERGAKLVSIITQTGSILNADVSSAGNTTGGYNDQFVNLNAINPSGSDHPYYYVIYGKESK